MKTGITVLHIAQSTSEADGLIAFMQNALPEAKCWREDQRSDPRVHPWEDQPAHCIRVIAEVPVRRTREGFTETKHPLGRMVRDFLNG